MVNPPFLLLVAICLSALHAQFCVESTTPALQHALQRETDETACYALVGSLATSRNETANSSS
jgi:hypothetical protein